jgi:hypothetical protein
MLNDFFIGKLEEMDVFESNSLARCSTWPRSHLLKQCFERAENVMERYGRG